MSKLEVTVCVSQRYIRHRGSSYSAPVVVIGRDKFVAHKIDLMGMESLICALHLPELNEPNEPSPAQARPAWQWTSRARPQSGLGPSLGISARYDSDRAESYRAELARLALPSLPTVADNLDGLEGEDRTSG